MSDVDLGECGDLHNGCLNITFADFGIYFTSLDDKRRLFQLNKKKNPFSLNENNVCQVFYFSCGCVVILASFDYQENISLSEKYQTIILEEDCCFYSGL